jgi:hypothetical protein
MGKVINHYVEYVLEGGKHKLSCKCGFRYNHESRTMVVTKAHLHIAEGAVSSD